MDNIHSQQNFCIYYQAQVPDAYAWFLVAIARSWEHVAFDRTIDTTRGIFEFFVPSATHQHFLAMMRPLIERGVVKDLVQVPNRLVCACEHSLEKF